jgi:hypothetical protein
MFIDIIFIKYEKSKIVEIFFVSIQGVPLALRAAGQGAPPFPHAKQHRKLHLLNFFSPTI